MFQQTQLKALAIMLTLFLVGCADGDKTYVTNEAQAQEELSIMPYSVEPLPVFFNFVNNDPMTSQLCLGFKITANEPLVIEGAVVDAATSGLINPRVFFFAGQKSSYNTYLENSQTAHMLMRQDPLILDAGKSVDFYFYFNSEGLVDSEHVNSFLVVNGVAVLGYRIADTDKSRLIDFEERIQGPIFPENTEK